MVSRNKLQHVETMFYLAEHEPLKYKVKSKMNRYCEEYTMYYKGEEMWTTIMDKDMESDAQVDVARTN